MYVFINFVGGIKQYNVMCFASLNGKMKLEYVNKDTYFCKYWQFTQFYADYSQLHNFTLKSFCCAGARHTT